MGNTFFDMHSSHEQYDEIHQKYLRLTSEEIRAVSVSKSRVYLSVADMDFIQDALQIMIQTAEEIGGLNETDQRRAMQMGYGLEKIKHKLQKRINTVENNNG
jgi:hypothetical protein